MATYIKMYVLEALPNKRKNDHTYKTFDYVTDYYRIVLCQ